MFATFNPVILLLIMNPDEIARWEVEGLCTKRLLETIPIEVSKNLHNPSVEE